MTGIANDKPGYKYLADKGHRILRNGYNIVPIQPGEKYPSVKGWQKIATTKADLDKWVSNGRASHGVGITTGDISLFDLDISHHDMNRHMTDYCILNIGFAPERVGNPPKVGLVYRSPKPFGKITSKEYVGPDGRKQQIEVLGKGQQFVAYHEHPDTKKPYTWMDDKFNPEATLASELVEVTEAQARACVAEFERKAEELGWPLKEKAPTLPAQTPIANGRDTSAGDDDNALGALPDAPDWPAKRARIISALKAIPIAARADHDRVWLPCGMVLHFESEGRAFKVWEDWSRPASNFDAKKTCRETWDSFKRDNADNPRTIGTLIDIAKRYGWTEAKPGIIEPAIGGKFKHGGEYKMQNVEWIWPGWLARGKYHVIAGRKSGGKSTVLFSFVAAVTNPFGGVWPDGTPAPFGDVIIWSSEDGIADTILPRISLMGGDVTRVRFVDHVTVAGGKERRFDPSIDMPLLEEMAKTLPDLVIVGIDPIVSASRGDGNKNAETRIGLQPVVDFAEKRNIALIGITHFTKNTQGKDPLERITGSLAYAALARVAMGVASDLEDMTKPRRLVRIASNIGPTGGGFEYSLDQKVMKIDGDNLKNQKLTWDKTPLTGSALRLILEIEGEQDTRRGPNEALEFLQRHLLDAKDGAAISDLRDLAETSGIAWRTIERERGRIKEIITSKKRWIWTNPEDEL